MEIKDRLRQIEKTRLGQRTSSSADLQSTCVTARDLSKFDDRGPQPPVGSVLVKEWDFPVHHTHGRVELGACLSVSPSLLRYVGKCAEYCDLDLRKAVFLDTETTSLSGGAGACAFLVGLGFFADDTFKVVQLFMRDFAAEPAQLDQLNQILADRELIVSYNGKSFDAPLLQSRNVLHRVQSPIEEMPHLDLLHAVRRHWKHCLPDCSLVTVESHILQASRAGDIPGYWIPHMYFQYLQTRNDDPLQAVFHHNQSDILALVAFLSRLLQLFEDPFQTAENVCELLSVARTYEDMSEFKRSVDLYDELLQRPSFTGDARLVKFQLARNLKRLKQWSRAADIWQECLLDEDFHPLPYLELAKHYEHRIRNYPMSLKFVNRALNGINVIEAVAPKKNWSVYKADLLYRRNRIRKRMSVS